VSRMRERRERKSSGLRPDVERDVDVELAFHFEMRERDYLEAGLSPEGARAAARERLGDLGEVRRWLTRHDKRRAQRLQTGEVLVEALRDLRHAMRRLLQQRAFALGVVSVLALGTGATTAIFSAVDAVLLRPLPFTEAERLALVSVGVPFDPGSTAEADFPKGGPDVTDVRAMRDVFTDVAAYAAGGLNLSDEANPRRLRVGVVTPNLFAMLGIAPLHGRLFTPAEEIASAPPAVILSEGFWRSYLAADTEAVGRSISMNGRSYEVVGVLPAGFGFPEDSEVWIPLPVPYTLATTEAFRAFLPSRTLARLAPGVTIEEAGQRTLALHASYAREGRPVDGSAAEMVRPFRDAVVGQRRTALLVLMGATALVLLVACANVANLLLAQATVRRREIALRGVLGATSGRVLQQLAAESLTLALVGTAAGLGLSLVAVRALDVLIPAGLAGAAPLRMDLRVLAFAFATALVTALGFGLWPAIEARRAAPGEALRRGAAGAGVDRGAARLRRAFVAGEVALALMLLVGSTLMLRSLHTLLATPTGIDPEGVATLELTLARTEHRGAAGRRRFYEDVLERLARDPRIAAAGAINELPMRGVVGIQMLMGPEGREISSEETPFSQLIRVTPHYFRAMGIPLLAGRPPEPVPANSETNEVVVSRTLARLFWPGSWPVGQRLSWPGGTFIVVGVVEDVRPTSLESEFIPQAYTAMMDSPDINAALVVRGQGDPLLLARALEDAVHEAAPTQSVYNVRSMEQVMNGAIRARRTNTFLIASFGALALALSTMGVYGVMAFSVARRTREIGIRMALGARAQFVMRSVLREGFSLALVGAMVGLLGAWGLSRVMAGLLYGVQPRDPLTFLLAPVVLMTAAVGAALVPAWRATRVDPVEAIRSE
jgi:putative ABC transport system permease protein